MLQLILQFVHNLGDIDIFFDVEACNVVDPGCSFN